MWLSPSVLRSTRLFANHARCLSLTPRLRAFPVSSRGILRVSLSPSFHSARTSPFSSVVPGSSIPTHSPTVSISSPPFVLVYGGNGSLGQAMISAFRAASWRAISVDYYENSNADYNILISQSNDWKTNTEVVTSSLNQLASSLADELPVHSSSSSPFSPYLSAVISVAGGWKGSSISSPALFDSTDFLISSNVLSSLSSSHLASHFLLPSSLLLLTGASAACQGTPTMLAYGLSKAAVHHLTLSLSSHDSELTARGIKVACMLPITIDTKNNREAMGKGDYSEWTPVEEFARAAVKWAGETESGRRVKGKGKEVGKEVGKDGEMEGVRKVKHAEGGERSPHGVPALAHGGFYEFRTSKNATTVSLIDDPLALGRVVAQ